MMDRPNSPSRPPPPDFGLPPYDDEHMPASAGQRDGPAAVRLLTSMEDQVPEPYVAPLAELVPAPLAVKKEPRVASATKDSGQPARHQHQHQLLRTTATDEAPSAA